MLDAIVIHGSEREVAEWIRALPTSGINSLLATVINMPDDRADSPGGRRGLRADPRDRDLLRR
jgi:hypothetical protein